ncbi:MAG: invasion associated locus B family protein [Devosiaceae bacterium]|nr:invasion associated locus B family protein [Devosiaceae bacterium]
MAIKSKLGLWSFVLLTGFIGAGASYAQSVQVLGDFRDWSAFTANDGSGPICFAMSKPREVTPTPDGYTQAYIYLTHRVSEGGRSEFNLIAGFEFAADSTALAKVGSNVFDLFTNGDAAWLEDPSIGSAFARSLRAGSTLIIEGTSALGVKVVQTYSLSGATAASRAIDRAC